MGSTRRTLRAGSEREKKFACLELLTATVTVLLPGYGCPYHSDCSVVAIQLSLLQCLFCSSDTAVTTAVTVL